MFKTYRYKLKLTIKQEAALLHVFDCVRFVYNWGLELKIKTCQINGKELSFQELEEKLVVLKKEKIFLNDIPVSVLLQTLRNLDKAFSSCNEKRGPKSKNRHYHSVTFKKSTDENVREGSCIYFDSGFWRVGIPIIGRVRICKNKPIESGWEIKTLTVLKDRCGDYWCMFVCYHDEIDFTFPLIEDKTTIGVDLGIRYYATLSDGGKVKNPMFLEKAKSKLDKLQKDYSKKTKDSKRREKARIRLAKLYRNVVNSRNNMLHLLSRQLIKDYNTICIEDLDVGGLSKNREQALSIKSAAWAKFRRQIKYKAEWYGKNVIEIDRFAPSSKMCHGCGFVNQKLKKEKFWDCPKCGLHHDRDINAAINIKNFALATSLE